MEGPPATAEVDGRGFVRRLAEGLSDLLAALTAWAWLWACRRVGARARTVGRPLVRNPGRIELGADVRIESRPVRVELAAGRQGRLIVGSDVRFGPGARVTASRYVEIGDRVRVGAGCVISDEAARHAPEDEARIWVGDGVTLGDGAVVAPGTMIGAGARVAPRCAVSGVVPPNTVVDGPRAPLADAAPDEPRRVAAVAVAPSAP